MTTTFNDFPLGWKQNPDELITPGDPETLFEVEVQLGEGSFGVVYRARSTTDGRKVAVKALPVFENCLQSAAHELKILRECDHPNIVGYYGEIFRSFLAVFDFDSWSGTWSKDCNLWIVMELCEGGKCQ
jgi:serine/threonine-protein kinase CLA4